MLIAYSAKAAPPRRMATAKNSPFTIALSKHLTTRGSMCAAPSASSATMC